VGVRESGWDVAASSATTVIGYAKPVLCGLLFFSSKGNLVCGDTSLDNIVNEYRRKRVSVARLVFDCVL
jgi:hypothetical protein